MDSNKQILKLGEQRRIQKAIAGKVYELELSPAAHAKLFKKLYREIKIRFEVSTYKEVKRKNLQEAIRYIESWSPSKAS